MSGRGRGRGAYYKAKYGRGGRGSGEGRKASTPAPLPLQNNHGSRDWDQLRIDLTRIDGQQYGAYKRLLGRYEHTQSPQFTLAIDHVQGDAYAAPSRVRAIVPLTVTGFPCSFLDSESKRISLCDFVTRAAADKIRSKHMDRNVGSSNAGWRGPKGGAFNINAPGQQVLPRTSCLITGAERSGDATAGYMELRFTVSLPAAGRTILAAEAMQILAVNLVEVVASSLLYSNIDQGQLRGYVTSVETQRSLRQQLSSMNLVAFIANGSILPRASGAQDTSMANGAIPFQSPPELETTIQIEDSSKITGMGIPRGITLLTGGGFHGKSTLLEAVQLGIYDVIPGDGREGVVTDPTAVKIRAEDGRSLNGVDVSPYISRLPGKDCHALSTDDASGSTSMAANIQEALESGCRTLVIDEDSSATNLLVRDERMQLLIQNEPITPLISKSRRLYEEHGVSMVIVVGGLGDWLSVADTVIMMDSYVPYVRTREAKAIVKQHPSSTTTHDGPYGNIPHRAVRVNFAGFRTPYATSTRFISVRRQNEDSVHNPADSDAGLDLGGIDQLVEVGQSRAIAGALRRIADTGSIAPLDEYVRLLADEKLAGIDTSLSSSIDGGDWVGVRNIEVAAALSRLRGGLLKLQS